MPGYPLMPGVLICEAAAQLCSYYCHLVQLVKDGFLGFGGMEDVRFRGPVSPGDRLLIVSKTSRLNRRQSIFETQCFVGNNLVFHAKISGKGSSGMPPVALIDPAAIDTSRVLYDRDAIRQGNPQRVRDGAPGRDRRLRSRGRADRRLQGRP